MEDEDFEPQDQPSEESSHAANEPQDDQPNEGDSYEALLAGQPHDPNGPLRGGQPSQPSQPRVMYREQDLYLPITNISRIMKRCLSNKFAKLSKDAKTTMQECVSEFIGFIASEACEEVRNERRLTLTGDDLIAAMERLGFRTAESNYIDPLKLYLAKYRKANAASGSGPSDPPTAGQ